jgi:hypothetical protein
MNRRSVGKQALHRVIGQSDEASAAAVSAPHPAASPCLSGFGILAASAAGQPALELPGLVASNPASSTPQPWPPGRTLISGPALLSLVQISERDRLIAEYVDRGGGWPVTSSCENAAFFTFLVSRLPDPSHAFSLCLLELALTRARLGAETFVEPEYRKAQGRSKADLRLCLEHEAWSCIDRAMQGRTATANWAHIERAAWDGVESAIWDGIEREAWIRLDCEAWQILERSARNRIQHGLYASLVWFHAEPESVLRALHGAPPPPVGEQAFPVLCGPGVPNLCRAATKAEAALWARLPADDTAPEPVERLLAEGIVRYTD